MDNKPSFCNKGISTPAGIIIIVVCALMAGGLMAWQQGWIPQERINQPKEETADWKTYTNSNYGYSIMYPADILINAAEACLNSAYDSDNSLVLFRKHTGNYYCGSDEPIYFGIYGNAKSPNLSDPCFSVTNESISVGGVQAEKRTEVFNTSKECASQEIGLLFNKYVEVSLLSKNNQPLRINYGAAGINKDVSESVLARILSTFKFTDQAEGRGCGGFAGETGDAACPSGYKCQYPKPSYPDAQGKCVKR